MENVHDLEILLVWDDLTWHWSERLWYQYHNWTEDQLGIDRPSALGVCGCAPGGKVLYSNVHLNINTQQTVKF